jgi:tetratricopeptide (TPR) repeat protein
MSASTDSHEQVELEAKIAERIDAAYDQIFERELDAAELMLGQCQTAAQTAGLIRQLIRSIYWLSYIASVRGEHFLAEQRLNTALVLAEKEENAALIAGIHSAFARLHFMRGRIDDAELALERALMYAHNSHDLRREAESYGLQGACRRSLGHFDDAHEYLQAAAVLWRNLPHEEVALTETLLDLSSVAFEIGMDEISAAAFSEAQHIVSGPAHPRLMSRGYVQQALCHLMLEDAPSAAALLEQARDLAGAAPDYASQLDLAAAYGRYYCAVGDHAPALAHFSRALRLAQNAQSRFTVAELRLEYARALVGARELEQAQAVLSDAEIAFEMFGAKPRLAQAYCIWTLCRLAEGRVDAAAAALSRAQELAGSLRQAGRTLTADLIAAQSALRIAEL